jgi:hypothetical protein
MTHTLPFYSITENARAIFHTNDACREGHLVEARLRRSGDGNRPRCEECKQLDADEYATRRIP